MNTIENTKTSDKKYLTAQDVVNRYSGNISARTLANWRNLGLGPKYVKLGGKIMYKIADLDDWEQRSTVQGTSQYRKVTT